jgi:hypothetical protein
MGQLPKLKSGRANLLNNTRDHSTHIDINDLN